MRWLCNYWLTKISPTHFQKLFYLKYEFFIDMNRVVTAWQAPPSPSVAKSDENERTLEMMRCCVVLRCSQFLFRDLWGGLTVVFFWGSAVNSNLSDSDCVVLGITLSLTPGDVGVRLSLVPQCPDFVRCREILCVELSSSAWDLGKNGG